MQPKAFCHSSMLSLPQATKGFKEQMAFMMAERTTLDGQLAAASQANARLRSSMDKDDTYMRNLLLNTADMHDQIEGLRAEARQRTKDSASLQEALVNNVASNARAAQVNAHSYWHTHSCCLARMRMQDIYVYTLKQAVARYCFHLSKPSHEMAASACKSATQSSCCLCQCLAL